MHTISEMTLENYLNKTRGNFQLKEASANLLLSETLGVASDTGEIGITAGQQLLSAGVDCRNNCLLLGNMNTKCYSGI